MTENAGTAAEPRECWECSAVAECHDHHPVPRSRGGTRTIPLCLECHGKAHHRNGAMSTSALTSAALQAKQARGEKVGGCAAYGKADGIDADRAAVEREILASIRTMRAAGMTVRAIADELDRLGHRTRTGGLIMHTQVARWAA